ncbi:unnamed protein product [Toxocara canis]|uniref:Uncharacterized protein n=1 Tax=Toxocara canis TaxID=6265 RepID=A0A183VAT2_TOXCA|nr:unnamed protein product [Toxocara canis]
MPMDVGEIDSSDYGIKVDPINYWHHSRQVTVGKSSVIPKTSELEVELAVRVKSRGMASQLRRGRRSSSTVREIFTTISNKALRRGLSPEGLPRRASEDSEGGTEMTDTGFTSDPGYFPILSERLLCTIIFNVRCGVGGNEVIH